MRKITNNEDTPDFPGKYDIEKIKFSGFLAQEVEQAAKESGYDFSGVKLPHNDHDLYTLSYEVFVVPLVKAVQEQQSLITALEKRAVTHEKEMSDQKKIIELLEQRLAALEKINSEKKSTTRK
jgi:hypothetical protein